MERNRKVFSGRVSELFGKAALPMDKFSRSLGYKRLAEEVIKATDADQIKILQAYCDGVNAFTAGIDFTNPDSTAKLLPPEFYTFGITGDKLEPWTTVDVVAMSKMISFHLTWNWSQDYAREAVRNIHPDFEEWLEALVPFTSEAMRDWVTIVDDDDLKQWGQYDEETLMSKYKKASETVKKASPPLQEKATEKSEQIDAEPIMTHSHLDDQMASNNWAIHGDHTASGKPLLANDPHLGNSIPSFW